jgi:hypothetical protein
LKAESLSTNRGEITVSFWICATCAVEHSEQVEVCAICADERQWVPHSGQVWTTLEKLAADGHGLVHEELEPGIHRLNRDPAVGIGQWTHLVQTPRGNLLWDPPTPRTGSGCNGRTR